MLKKSFIIILIIAISSIYFNAQTLRYSSDGKTLAANWNVTYGNYNNISQFLLFDAESGKLKTSFNADGTSLDEMDLNFTSGNQGLVIADNNAVSILTTTADNQTNLEDFVSEFGNYDKSLNGIAMSADGKKIYKVYADELVVYDSLTKKAIAEEGKKLSSSNFISISPNGRLLAEYEKKGAIHSMIIHDLMTKKAQRIKLPYGYEEEKKAKFDVQFSENGDRMAIKCVVDEEKSQISIWDIKTGLSVSVFSIPSFKDESVTDFYPVENFAFSPDGKKLAVKIHDKFNDDMKNLLFVWDIATKKEKLAEAKKYSVEEFADNFVFSPDSKKLAVSSQVLLPTSLSLKIQILDAATGLSVREF